MNNQWESMTLYQKLRIAVGLDRSHQDDWQCPFCYSKFGHKETCNALEEWAATYNHDDDE